MHWSDLNNGWSCSSVSEILWTSYEFVTVINGVRLKRVVKSLIYHKCLLFYICPETELFCNAAWQHFLECLGSDDSPSILFTSSLALHRLLAWCFLAVVCPFFPQPECLVNAGCSINCMFLTPSFPWRNKLIKSFLLYYFFNQTKRRYSSSWSHYR